MTVAPPKLTKRDIPIESAILRSMFEARPASSSDGRPSALEEARSLLKQCEAAIERADDNDPRNIGGDGFPGWVKHVRELIDRRADLQSRIAFLEALEAGETEAEFVPPPEADEADAGELLGMFCRSTGVHGVAWLVRNATGTLPRVDIDQLRDGMRLNRAAYASGTHNVDLPKLDAVLRERLTEERDHMALLDLRTNLVARTKDAIAAAAELVVEQTGKAALIQAVSEARILAGTFHGQGDPDAVKPQGRRDRWPALDLEEAELRAELATLDDQLGAIGGALAAAQPGLAAVALGGRRAVIVARLDAIAVERRDQAVASVADVVGRFAKGDLDAALEIGEAATKFPQAFPENFLPSLLEGAHESFCEAGSVAWLDVLASV